MPLRAALVFISPLVSLLLMPTYPRAHGPPGKRFFRTTLQGDNPFISDEFPVLENRITGSDGKINGIGVNFLKRILLKLGLEFHERQFLNRSAETFGVRQSAFARVGQSLLSLSIG